MTREETIAFMKDRLRQTMAAGMAAIGEPIPENFESFIDILGEQIGEDRFRHQIVMTQVSERVNELQALCINLNARVRDLEQNLSQLAKKESEQ